MARSRGPSNLVAHGPETETSAHADDTEMIVRDLGGRCSTRYRAGDDGRPVGTADLLLRPIALFLVAWTSCVVVLALWLWQAETSGHLPSVSASPPPARTTWRIDGRRSGRRKP